MMNYAFDFSQSETEKYFEWIINIFIAWPKSLLRFDMPFDRINSTFYHKWGMVNCVYYMASPYIISRQSAAS